MPRKKPRIEKIFQDTGEGYVIPPIQKPEPEKIEKIEFFGIEKPKVKRGKGERKIRTKVSYGLDEKEITPKISPDIDLKKEKKEYTLIICEKPQASMKVAYALADIAPVKRSISGVPYWEVNRNEKKFVVVSAAGHLFGLQEKIKTSSWPVFDIEWAQSTGYVKKYIKVIEYFAKNASDFILACDYDVEGELIGFNALRFLCKTEEARRMKFSTLTKHDLIKSYEEIEPQINFGQAYAGETRHYLDWFYGINLSRALMEAIKKAGSFKILSIGRVQGPALALIVSRENKILKFKPTPYWQVLLVIEDFKGQKIEVKFPENILAEKEAEKFLKLKGKRGIAKTEKQEQEVKPFPPFDLTTLQTESYKLFRFSPAQTLAIAQNLYLRGLVSYPRTSSQKLPPSIGYKRILEKLKKVYPKLVQITREFPVQGKKIDPAHPAIFPTGEQGKLLGDEKKIYELIVKRFLACFAEDALVENKKIQASIDEKDFFAEGKKIIKHGWLNIYPYKIQEQELPDVEGEVLVKEARMEEKMTEPPKRYSPASIILELEKRKLGTKTTRAIIIDTLYKRGYIIGTQIQATQLGIATVETLERNCPLILDEKLTREFEEKMDKILEEKEKEKMQKQESKILEEAKQVILKISEQFKSKEKEIGHALLEAIQVLEKEKIESNKLFLCLECKKGYLIMKRSFRGKRFAYCNNEACKKIYALPQYGMIKVSDIKCEKCGLVKLVLIKKSKLPWYFCINPDCWLKE